jgi:Tol biopolymer transport system component
MPFAKVHFFSLAARFTGAMALCAVIATSAFAQPVKISGGLVNGGNVSDQYEFSPDGRWVVFVADKDVDGKNELYSVRLATREITKISGDVLTGLRGVEKFAISPDSRYVVYLGNMSSSNLTELYVVPVGGGVVTTLSAPNPDDSQSLVSFKISPDGRRVVFKRFEAYITFPSGGGAPVSNTRTTLYSNSIVGGDLVLISLQPTYPASREMDEQYLITPDSRRVMILEFVTDTFAINSYSLKIYSSQIDLGGNTALIANNLTDIHQPVSISYAVSPDGVYFAYSQREDSSTLNVARVDGSGVRIVDRSAGYAKLAFSPDSRSIVAIRIVETPILGGMREDKELISARIESGNEITLYSRAAIDGAEVFSYLLSPDGQTVVFMAQLVANEPWTLLTVPINGGAVQTIASSSFLGNFFLNNYRLSPDGKWVVFFVRPGAPQPGVHSVPIQGGTPINLSGAIIAGGAVDDDSFVIAPDSSRVAFVGTLTQTDTMDLYSTPIGGGARARLTNGESVRSPAHHFDAFSSRILFLASAQFSTKSELFMVQAGGTALTMDFDGDDRILAHTDLLMLIRRHLGANGGAVTAGALSANATISNATTIQTRIDAVRNDLAGINRPLDVDLSGSVGASTDLLMLVRYALGFRGSAITQGALGSGAQRTNPTSIENYIRTLFTTYQLSGQG